MHEPLQTAEQLLTLPRCLACRMHKGYEEITVPAVKQSGMGEGETLVAVSTLPAWAQTAFQGYKCALKLFCSLHLSQNECRGPARKLLST